MRLRPSPVPPKLNRWLPNRGQIFHPDCRRTMNGLSWSPDVHGPERRGPVCGGHRSSLSPCSASFPAYAVGALKKPLSAGFRAIVDCFAAGHLRTHARLDSPSVNGAQCLIGVARCQAPLIRAWLLFERFHALRSAEVNRRPLCSAAILVSTAFPETGQRRTPREPHTPDLIRGLACLAEPGILSVLMRKNSRFSASFNWE
jgi:hypothetical protein